MSTSRTRRRALLVSLPLLAAACLSPGEPPRIQYYSPAVAGVDDVPGTESAEREPSGRQLWIRRVDAAEHIKQRFVWSRGGVEYGFRELARWTEEPAQFLRRALESQLYPVAFRRSDTARAYVLEVELRAFEEQLGPEPRARVTFFVVLRDSDGGSLLERLVDSETAIEGEGHDATARAISRSLAAATAEAVEAIDQAAQSGS